MKKRILTALLAMCVAFTSVPIDVKAYEQTTEVTEESEAVENEAEESLTEQETSAAGDTVTEDSESTDTPEESEKATEISDVTENIVTEEAETIKETEAAGTENAEAIETEAIETGTTENTEAAETENTEAAETETAGTEEAQTEETENTEATEETERTEEDAAEGTLNYIMMLSDYIETPGTQQVIASIGTEAAELKDIVLSYCNTATKEEFKVKAENKAEDMVLFEIAFEQENQTGIYQLTSITYILKGEKCEIALSEQEMKVQFGVNKEVETNPDQILVEEGTYIEDDAEVSASVVTMDENGNVVSENTVENVLGTGIGEIAALGLERPDYSANVQNDDLVVVLDAGHDKAHGNANANNGVTEAELVLKIANYCKNELETYAGVKVYMTRTSADCPYGGNITAKDCLIKRAEYAKSVGADVLVSLHLNALSFGSANGAEVYYPNSNYNQKIGEDGKALAEDIIKKLEALGIKARGIYTKNAQTDKYPDGSVADYYTLMRESKQRGILAVIVEHAFLKDSTDYVNFLNSEEKLKKLGIADAEAIAECYGLKKKSQEKPVISYTQSRSDGSIKIKWKKVSDAASYEIYRKEKDNAVTTLIGTTTSSSFIDEKVTVGTKYYYKIKAIFSNNTSGTESKFVGGCALKKAEITSIKSEASKKVKITWEKVENASGYKIYRQNVSTGEYEQIAKVESGKTTSYVDKVDSNNKKYYYKVQAYGLSNGKEGVGAKSTGKGGKSIAKPTIKSVTSDNKDEIEINWKKVDGASGYIITRSTKKDSGYKKIATIKSSSTVSYVDKNIKTGKNYYYKLEAYINVGSEKGYSGETAAVQGKTIGKTSINYVISKDSSTLEINWDKVEGAWGYLVKRRASSENSYKTIATVEGGSNITYKDKNVETGTKYYYKVETIAKVNGTKIYSGTCSAVSGKTLKATSVTAVKAESSTKLTITWKKVSGIDGYQVYRSTSKNGTYEKIATVDSYKTTSYTDKKVKAGKTYYYKLRTYKQKDKKTEVSSYSDKQKAVTVKKADISKVSSNNSKQVTIYWDKVSNADGYRITRSTKKSSGFKTIAEVESGDILHYADKTVEAGKTYYYRVTALVEGKGNEVGRGDYSDVMEVPVLKKVKISSITLQEGNALKIKWSACENADGYQLMSCSKKEGEYSLVKKTGSKTYTHKNLNEGTTYYYRVRAYKELSNGNTVYSAWSTIKEQTTGHTIMGESSVTADDMVEYYNERYTYPADTYKSKGAKNAEKFFKILKEEAEAEGVKTEVLFAQVILETGGLQFGGDVKPEQCNFGGLGATGGGVGGETFENVRLGLRAQVQHLKAYACNDALKNECVDTRFAYVTRNSAPYIEWLSIPNNPYGKGWATDKDYAAKLLSIMNKL